MVSGVQDPDVLRDGEGAQGEATGVEQAQQLPRVHHHVPAHHAGPESVSPEEMEIPHSRRGAHDQELAVAAVYLNPKP